MADDRPSGFIIFMNDFEKTKRLSDSEFRQWITACTVYAETGEILDLPDMAALCFDFVKARIDQNVDSYKNRCQANRENGKKGGRPPKTQTTRQNPMGFSETQHNPQNPNRNRKEKEKQEPFSSIRDILKMGVQGEGTTYRPNFVLLPKESAESLAAPPEIRELHAKWISAMNQGDRTLALSLSNELFVGGYDVSVNTGQLSKRK